ncbi:MAG: DUF302 domain-containing protein [Acidobacteriota bacterium]
MEEFMKYVRDTDKSVDEAVSDVEAAVQRHGFGVLHTYDFKATLRSKGFDLPDECRVLEVCNPRQASEILRTDMSVNMALPCRISVYEDGGQTRIGMIRPTALLKLVSESAGLASSAEEVERTIVAIIDESV